MVIMNITSVSLMTVSFSPLQRVLLQGVSFLEMHSLHKPLIILYYRCFLPTLLVTCTLLFVGDEDFVADPTVSTIVLSGNETKKCVNVTIIDDQTVERTEPFAVTITFPSDQPALQSGEIVPREMQINGLINIIDDDGELI